MSRYWDKVLDEWVYEIEETPETNSEETATPPTE
jgi:hypothetical protein